MIPVLPSFFREYKNMLKGKGIPFTLYINNASMKIQGGGPIYFTSEAFDEKKDKKEKEDLRKYFFFINKVKNHVESRIKSGKIKLDKTRTGTIKYFDMPFNKVGSFHKCVEVDIDGAYWETAYKIGIIDKKLYREGKKKSIPKKVRLVALGGLAKSTKVFRFDGNEMIQLPSIENEDTQICWNMICYHTADIMTTIASNIDDKDYFFYWVDAVFVRGSVLNDVTGMISKLGYKFKVKSIKKITYGDKVIMVDKKPFYLPGKRK